MPDLEQTLNCLSLESLAECARYFVLYNQVESVGMLVNIFKANKGFLENAEELDEFREDYQRFCAVFGDYLQEEALVAELGLLDPLSMLNSVADQSSFTNVAGVLQKIVPAQELVPAIEASAPRFGQDFFERTIHQFK